MRRLATDQSFTSSKRPFQSAGVSRLLGGEMRRDLGAALLRERPRARSKSKSDVVERDDGNLAHFCCARLVNDYRLSIPVLLLA